jgi:Kef-type K+ transport system membrane component KefB
MSLLAQMAIFLAAAVIAIPIFRYFKLGSVLGLPGRRNHHRSILLFQDIAVLPALALLPP